MKLGEGQSGAAACLRRFAAAAMIAMMFAAILVGERLTPLGFVHGALYAPLLPAAAVLTRSTRIVAWMTLAALVAIALGYVLSPPAAPGITVEMVYFNRGAAALVCLLMGVLCWLGMRSGSRERDAERRAGQAAPLLEIASRIGQLGAWSFKVGESTVTWSSEVARIHGFAEGHSPALEDAIGFYAPEYQPLIRARFEACLSDGTPYDEDLQLLTRSGGRRWVRAVGIPMRDARGAIVGAHGAFQDIQERKLAEVLAQQHLRQWMTLAEAMPIAVWTATQAGAVDYASPSLLRYSGLGLKSLCERWAEIIHPDDRQRCLEAWRESLRSGAPFEVEFRIRRYDGHHAWHLTRAVRVADLAAGEPKWYGTATEIEALKQLERRANALAGRLSEIMESVGDAIFTLDEHWRFTYVSGRAATLLERPVEELAGKVVWEEFPQARDTVFQHEYERCMRTGSAVRFEAPYAPLNVWFEVNARRFEHGITVYFRDVTEQRKLREQLLLALKLESIGQLTGGVAHDFNNLLTVIIGNADLLAEGGCAQDETRETARLILRAAERGADLTRALLAVARRQPLEPTSVSAVELLEQMVPLLRRTLGAQIEIRMHAEETLWAVEADAGQLESLVLNLALNARDAMPSGGCLVFECANRRLEGRFPGESTEIAAGDYVMLAVSDTGVGMPEAVKARVFEPFFTTKDKGGGTGLGLAMVYGFVRQSGGHVSVYSEAGKGTTFKVYLPRGQAQQLALPAEGLSELPLGEGRLVLVVEDDELVRAFAVGQLGQLNYRVLEAACGPQALEILRSRDDVQLLFTDVVMPGGMTGRQLADAACALRPGLSVLFASGYTENAIVHQGRLEQGVRLLNKPYRRAELAVKVHTALQQCYQSSPVQPIARPD